jgi:predicted metal-dependent HD superfamily phosphohydrolase
MKQIGVPQSFVEKCKKQILATKDHEMSASSDTNYFTDADLSVLGQPWDVYSTYINSIRKEYAVYPDVLYKPGRRKVVQHFLNMDQIYKTPYFHEKFESHARENLHRELSSC